MNTTHTCIHCLQCCSCCDMLFTFLLSLADAVIILALTANFNGYRLGCYVDQTTLLLALTGTKSALADLSSHLGRVVTC